MENKTLYVGNLVYSVTKEQLQDLFNEHGSVVDVRIIEGKGFAFVEMSELSEAEEAKDKLNGQEFLGRTLRIDEARPKKKRHF